MDKERGGGRDAKEREREREKQIRAFSAKVLGKMLANRQNNVKSTNKCVKTRKS